MSTESGDQGIRYHNDGAVGMITIDSPDDDNLLSRTALKRLLALAGEIRADGQVHAVLITGAGDDFFSTWATCLLLSSGTAGGLPNVPTSAFEGVPGAVSNPDMLDTVEPFFLAW